MVWIASSGVLDGSTNGITFSSIPQNFTHLHLRITARSARTASTNDRVYCRFNSDSATNYTWHELYGDGSSPYGQAYAPDNVFYTGFDPAASTTASVFASEIVDILDYANVSKFKTVRAIDGYDGSGSGIVSLRSGLWRSNAAITSLFLGHYYTGANFVAGSRVDLYGLTTSSATGA